MKRPPRFVSAGFEVAFSSASSITDASTASSEPSTAPRGSRRESDASAPDAVLRHLRDVEQALEPRLELDERAELGDPRDGAGHDRVGGEARRRVLPGIGLQRLHREPDPLPAVLDLQDLRLHFLPDGDDRRGVLDAPAREVADVDESFDPVAEVDERAEGLDARHLAADRLPRGEATEALLHGRRALLLEHRAPREEDPLARAVDFEHLAGQRLGDVAREVALVPQRDLGRRQERRHRADLGFEPAGVLPGDPRLDQRADLDLVPGGEGLDLAAREHPQVVFAAVQREIESLPDLRHRVELLPRRDALHARAEFDEHVVAGDADDRAAPDVRGRTGRRLRGRGRGRGFPGVEVLEIDAVERRVDLGGEGVLRVAGHAGGDSTAAPAAGHPGTGFRVTTLVLACADAHITISPTLTRGGRVTAHTIASATSRGRR